MFTIPSSSSSRVALVLIDVQHDFGDASGALFVPGGDRIVTSCNALRASLVETLGAPRVSVFLTQDWHPADHVSFAANNHGPPALFSIVPLADGHEQIMWPVHCVAETAGAAFLPALHVGVDDVVIRKGCNREIDSYSGFGSPAEREASSSPSGSGSTMVTGSGSTTCAAPRSRRETTQLEALLRSRSITHVVLAGLALDFCVSFTALDARNLGLSVCLARYATAGIAHESIKRETEAMESAGVIVADNLDDVIAFCTSAAAEK